MSKRHSKHHTKNLDTSSLSNAETETALKLAGIASTSERRTWLGSPDPEEIEAALNLAGNPKIDDPIKWFYTTQGFTPTTVNIGPVPKWIIKAFSTHSNDDK